jgi:hypothetical protein
VKFLPRLTARALFVGFARRLLSLEAGQSSLCGRLDRRIRITRIKLSNVCRTCDISKHMYLRTGEISSHLLIVSVSLALQR